MITLRPTKWLWSMEGTDEILLQSDGKEVYVLIEGGRNDR